MNKQGLSFEITGFSLAFLVITRIQNIKHMVSVQCLIQKTLISIVNF